jgi:hypothetical protein
MELFPLEVVLVLLFKTIKTIELLFFPNENETIKKGSCQDRKP